MSDTTQIDPTQLRLVRHNVRNVAQEVDPAFPFMLKLVLRNVDDIGMQLVYGETEEVVVQGMSLEALEALIVEKRFRTHARFISLTVTGPDGVVEHLERARG